MNIPTDMPRLKGFRLPREVISYAVWAYHRFALNTAEVEDLLAARGVLVSREAVRFGRHFADCIKRDRPNTADKWHLDEVVIPGPAYRGDVPLPQFAHQLGGHNNLNTSPWSNSRLNSLC